MERYAHDPGHDVLTDGTRRSGWSITTPTAQTDEERTLRKINAGELQACNVMFTEYYGLPEGTLLQFAGGKLVEGHLVDQAALGAIAERDPSRPLGEILRSGEASRPLFPED